MTLYALDPNLPNLHGHYARDLPPVLTIASGDTVRYRTLDAGWCEFEQADPFAKPTKLAGRNRARDPGHALVGPIAIEGAQPGMALEARFKRIRTGAWGWSTAGGWPSAWNERLGVSNGPEWMLRWKLNTVTGLALNQHGQRLPLRPFMGNYGMPPAEAGSHSTYPPRVTGGNIDCKELVEGSVVYLPMAVPGGLFSVGDGHAVQGDGEVSGVAIECPMSEVEIEFHVRPDMHLTYPRAFTPAGWITFGFHEDLDEAVMIALDGMLDLMRELYRMERKEALVFASLLVDVRVTQIVNGTKGAHAVLAPAVLAGLGR